MDVSQTILSPAFILDGREKKTKHFSVRLDLSSPDQSGEMQSSHHNHFYLFVHSS